MKFAKELEQELVPEWRTKYLDYKAGKKYVKAVEAAVRKGSGSPTLQRRFGDPPPYATCTATCTDAGGRTLGLQRTQSPALKPINTALASCAATADARGPSTTAAQPFSDWQNEKQRLADSPSSRVRYGSFSAATPHTAVADFELPEPAMESPKGSRSPVATPKDRLKRLFSHPSPTPTPPRVVNLRIDTTNINQDEIRQREDEFFTFLDSELDKVETFYRQKEDQAGEKLATLCEQLHVMRNKRTQELAELARQREEEQANRGGGPEDNGGSKHSSPKSKWLGQDALESLFTRKPGPNSKALQQMPQTPFLAADGLRDYARRPTGQLVPYRTAKHRLKLALQEFYRALELLKAYAMLNRTAFQKLNKKYDKAVNLCPQWRYMYNRVTPSYFVRSTVVDDHIAAVEDLYARYFGGGNHKLAVGKLRRISRKTRDESGTSFRSGLLIGVGAVFALQGLSNAAEQLMGQDQEVALRAKFLLQIYGGYFLMLYLFFLFCLDCRVWAHNKVNYQFVFEFDTRSQLDWRQLSQFPSFFLLFFGVMFWVNFSRVGPHDAMYLYIPVILIGVTALIIFFPAPVLYHRSRRWLLYTHWRVLVAGLYPVEFRDFFLADMYSSLAYAMSNIELLFCLYRNNWVDPDQCDSSHSRLMGFLSTLPLIWRFLQCIRRYTDTGNVFPHMINACKYAIGVAAAASLSLYRIDRTPGNLALFITLSSVNAVCMAIWDVYLDFSLLQPTSQNFLLRDTLGLKSKWPYYVIMVADPVLRFIWIFYAIFLQDAQHSTIMSFGVAAGEVTRRGIWLLLRVENEHCANVGQQKASRDVPLPYTLAADDSHKQQQPPSTPQKRSGDNQGGILHRDKSPPSATSISGTQTPESTQRTTATGINMGGVGDAKQGAAQPTDPNRGSTEQEREASSSSATPSDTEEGRAGFDGGGAADATNRVTRMRRRLTWSGTRAAGRLSRILADAHKQDFEKRRRPSMTTPDADDEEEEDEDEVRYRNNMMQSRGAPGYMNDDDAASFSKDEDESEDRRPERPSGRRGAVAAGASGPAWPQGSDVVGGKMQ